MATAYPLTLLSWLRSAAAALVLLAIGFALQGSADVSAMYDLKALRQTMTNYVAERAQLRKVNDAESAANEIECHVQYMKKFQNVTIMSNTNYWSCDRNHEISNEYSLNDGEVAKLRLLRTARHSDLRSVRESIEERETELGADPRVVRKLGALHAAFLAFSVFFRYDDGFEKLPEVTMEMFVVVSKVFSAKSAPTSSSFVLKPSGSESEDEINLRKAFLYLTRDDEEQRGKHVSQRQSSTFSQTDASVEKYGLKCNNAFEVRLDILSPVIDDLIDKVYRIGATLSDQTVGVMGLIKTRHNVDLREGMLQFYDDYKTTPSVDTELLRGLAAIISEVMSPDSGDGPRAAEYLQKISEKTLPKQKKLMWKAKKKMKLKRMTHNRLQRK